MRKITSKTLLISSFLFSFIFTLSACKNSVAPEEETTSDSCQCTIYIETPSKTATPVLPDNIWYTLIAAQEPIAPDYDENEVLKPALIEDGVEYKLESNHPGTNYYVMDLKHNGTWYFYIEGYTSSTERNKSNRILVGSTSGEAKGKHYYVSLKVDFLPGGNGVVNLPIDVSETNIDKLKITNAGDGVLNGTYNRNDSDKIIISAENIPAGAYPATLTFYKDDVIIFRIQNETINVKDNMVTDAWIYSEHCDYLEPQEITHSTDDSAFPSDERTITDTAKFKITPEYLHKRCNTFCYVSKNGTDSNIGSKLKPFSSLQPAFKHIVALNENFYRINEKETFTIYIDGLLEDDDIDYYVPETTNPLSVIITPEPSNTGTCETKGHLKFAENYNITIDAGATSDDAKKRFKFNDIVTHSPISINNCTIQGDLTFDGALSFDGTEKTSTIYNSIIGSTSSPVDFTVINSKVAFINPDESLDYAERGSITAFSINNMSISQNSDVEIYNSASTSQAAAKISDSLKINSSTFKISNTILSVTETTEIKNCTQKVEFGSGTDFTTKYYDVYNCSNLVIDGPLDNFTASSSFYAEDSTLKVSNSSLSTQGTFTLKNCNSEFKGEEWFQTEFDLSGQFELIGGTTDIVLYTFTVGAGIELSQNAKLTGNMIALGPDSDNYMNSLKFKDSTVELVDSKVYYKDDLEINNTNFSFINKNGRKLFYGKDAASFTITGSTVEFENAGLNFENVSALQNYIKGASGAKKKTIFDNSEITIRTTSSKDNDKSYFRGDIFVDENTNLSFIDSRITAGNLLVDNSSKAIFSGSSVLVRAADRIYLDRNAKFYVQNPPSDKNTTIARLFDLNPIDNQSLVVLYDSNKNEIDFTSDFDDTDKRYTVENVGFKLTYNNSENVRKGMLTYDTDSLSNLLTNWGARMRYDEIGTGNDAIIGATQGASGAEVPAVSSYNLAAAKEKEIIGGLWSKKTDYTGNLFGYIKEITYSIFYGDEVIAAQTSMNANKSMFILSELETDLENKLSTNNSVEYNIRMTFVYENTRDTTNNGNYTCNIPLIVTKN